MHDLGTLGGQFSTGYAINDAGQVVGEANIAGPRLLGHAFLYTNCQMNDLGTLGGTYSVGYDIDNTGQVVGTSTLSNGRADAFVYSDGQLYDVNDLIDPTQGITLSSTTAINDKGQKLANDFPHSYLLTPVPGPSNLGVFGVILLGLGGICIRGYRNRNQ